MIPRSDRRRLVAPAAFTLLALASFAFTVDDAYITLRYARNVAAGLGPVFDAQSAREAYSSPLWTLLSTIPFVLRLPDDTAVVFVKIVGLAFGVLTVLLTGPLAGRDGAAPDAAVAAALILSLMPWIAFWSVGGLETPLYCASIAGALVVHRRERAAGRAHAGSGMLFACVALTRPEGIAVALAALIAPIAATRLSQRNTVGGELRHAAPALALVCLTWLLFEVWRVEYYGALLPSTVAAKTALTVHSLRMRAVELLPFAAYVLPLVLLALWTRGSGLDAAGWGAVFAVAAFAAVPRLEGAPGFRYEVPLLPLLAAASAPGLVIALTARRAIARASLAALLVGLLTPLFWLRSPARFAPSRVEIGFGRWLAAFAPDARLAVYDLGAVPYYSRAPFILDTNPRGPLSPFPHTRYDLDAILAWSPSFLLLPAAPGHPADPLAALARHPAFLADYAPLFDMDAGNTYRLTVWKRKDVDLAPGALTAAEAMGLYQRRVSRSGARRPKYSYALAVATRPRGVRSRNPA